MKIKLLLPLLFISSISFASPQEDAPQANSALDHIRYSIFHDQPQETLEKLNHYPDKKSYFYYLYSANTLFILSNPQLALSYYNLAYTKAINNDEKKAALFGITRSALWLEQYTTALNAFDKLSIMALNREEQEVIATGRVNSSTNTDYPRIAFSIFEHQAPVQYPASVIAGSKAALAAGWGYKAKKIWNENTQRLQEIPPNSFFGKQRSNTAWMLKQQTSEETAGLDYFSTQDSTSFKIQRESAYGSYRLFGINSNTSIQGLKNQYFNPTIMAVATEVLIKQNFININDQLDINLTAVPTHVTYKPNDQPSWNPILWNGGFQFHANDYWVLSAYNSSGLVETIQALENQIEINSSEGSLFFHPYPKLYVRASGFHNKFTNHNNRNGGAGSINYQLISELGVFSELRYRGYHNSYYTEPYYFSPFRLQEGMAFLIMKRRFSNTLTLYAEGGLGLQSILNTPQDAIIDTQVATYNINLTQQIGTIAELNLTYGYTQNAFNNFVGAYAQTYFGANIKFFLD